MNEKEKGKLQVTKKEILLGLTVFIFLGLIELKEELGINVPIILIFSVWVVLMILLLGLMNGKLKQFMNFFKK